MEMIEMPKRILINRYPALGYKNFKFFLIGQCVSLIGTWMQKAAQQWVIYDITKSPFILGLVGVFGVCVVMEQKNVTKLHK